MPMCLALAVFGASSARYSMPDSTPSLAAGSAAPVSLPLELTVLRWIAEAIGYPAEAAGILTSGGSMANLGSIVAARSAYEQAHGPLDSHQAVLYVSNQGHASFDKAARVVGFPASAIRHLETDDACRLQPDTLEAAIAQDLSAGKTPLLVSANAGTTNTGAIDPLAALADVARQNSLWFHVDAAYGGFAAISSTGRSRLGPLDVADSITLDPHKWLYVPMGVGCLLVRDRAALEPIRRKAIRATSRCRASGNLWIVCSSHGPRTSRSRPTFGFSCSPQRADKPRLPH